MQKSLILADEIGVPNFIYAVAYAVDEMTGTDVAEVVGNACRSYAGWTEQKVEETLKNKQLSERLHGTILDAEKFGATLDRTKFNLIYQFASKTKPQIAKFQATVVKYIAEGKLSTEIQLNAALEFLLSNIDGFELSKFEDASGIGVVVTAEDVEAAVKEVLGAHAAEIIAKPSSAGKFMGEVRSRLKFADGKLLKDTFDRLRDDLVKNPPADLSSRGNGSSVINKTLNTTKTPNQSILVEGDTSIDGGVLQDVDVGDFLRQSSNAGAAAGYCGVIKGAVQNFHRPGENFKTDGYVLTPQTTRLMSEHVEQLKVMAAQSGISYPIVVTRFPPEPNGILHIGHAKAININFGYAKANNGLCYLRYDDTNPEKEDMRFVLGIRDMVEWLGYKPYKVTHASDNFERLYELAVELTRRGLAYVCHQRQEELKGHDAIPSPWRDRPVAESLRLLADMRAGKLNEGEAILRMKFIMDDGKMDPVAYRIKFKDHPQKGNKWCIYPTYDFTHCLCDSIENITHSLCTKEFQNHRSAYYWLCNSLDVYCPVQWEYGRLAMNYTVLSKRKIDALIRLGIVSDWDDPRLFTLSGLRRRGFPPEAINLFAAKVGVTMATSVLDPSAVEACVRDVLNLTAPRAMVCLDPIPVEIVNFSADLPSSLDVPDFPADELSKKHPIPFSRKIYIDRSDFLLAAESDRGFRRLTRTQPVGLKYVGAVIAVKEVEVDPNDANKVKSLKVEVIGKTEKPKCFIHWVETDSAVPVEVRLYNRLFKSKRPDDAPGGYTGDLAPDSLVVMPSAVADVSVGRTAVDPARPYDTRFQFERHGYFCAESSSGGKLVFNRTVELKEDKGKDK